VTSRLSTEQCIEILQLQKQGLSQSQIARVMGRSWGGVKMVLRPTPTMKLDAWDPSSARLSMLDREEIRAGLVRRETLTAIACSLGRSVSTVSREVANNGGRETYRAFAAHRRAAICARRPKSRKLDSRSELLAQVEEWLIELWSPEQIAQRLRIDFPSDPMMWVSHETIYQSLFVQGRGALRRELSACLRTGRATRRPATRVQRRGKLPEMVMISDRPAEVVDRAIPGHWEGDLIIGKNNGSAVGTLVERSTRYVLLLRLSDGYSAEKVRVAMTKAIRRLPAELTQSITWDQGKEMAQHQTFTVDTGVQIYFCDPHSPWQRGSNENTNGLLRQFLPKGKDLSTFSAQDLREIERKLNGRPRETLSWMKPCEKMTELLAMTG
jgi:transposase, IS30 family